MIIGEETKSLLEVFKLHHGITDQGALDLKVAEATRILSHHTPDNKENTVGLALGFVQSGKTMSFTTLAALAADNNYKVIIAILGNTNLLLDQNTSRLMSDLRIDGPAARTDYRWAHLPMPSERTDIDWFLDQSNRTILITTMKNRSRIDKITKIFEASIYAKDINCLIIDDEADQASLNTKVRKGEESATYAAINRLRSSLPSHLYIQYTATPFAPLLLEPVDHLAPSFLELLTPGKNYTGGESFFIEHRAQVVRSLPDDEFEQYASKGIPDGLKESIDAFLTSSALMKCVDGVPHGASMLIHTSGFKIDHKELKDIVERYLSPLRTKAKLDSDDPAWRSVITRMNEIKENFLSNGIEPVDQDKFEKALAAVVAHAKTWAVNSDKDEQQLDWGLSPYNILVGGNKLDRGFTVKDLTISYMTRGVNNSQADTIEQRARNFGYKANYLQYCRFYAPQGVIAAFTSLTHAEADMRASLITWIDAGQPLQMWSANEGLLLPDGIKPTRPNVVNDLYQRSFTDWSWQTRPTFEPAEIAFNMTLMDSIGLTSAKVQEFGAVHLSVLRDISTDLLVEKLLVPWKTRASGGWDQPLLIRALTRLSKMGVLETMNVVYFQLKENDGSLVPRERKYHYELDCFGNLVQGSNVGTNYPGDRNLFEMNEPVLQIHRVTPTGENKETYALGLFIPKNEGTLDRQVLRGLLSEL